MGRARIVRWYICFLNEGYYLPDLPSFVIVWRPKKRVFTTEAGEWVERGEEFFPGYVILGTSRGWGFLKQKLGSFLLGNGVPAILSSEEVKRIRNLESEFDLVDHVFRPGQFIHIPETARSSYAGLYGRFIKRTCGSESTFAKVRLNLFGEKQIDVDVPLDFLVNVDQ